MEEQKSLNIGVKNFIKIVALLYVILFAVGILTYVIPAGQYGFTADGEIIPDSFTYITSTTRLPWYRWLTAPFESAIFGAGNLNMFQVIAIILLLGGCFKVLEVSGGINSLIKVLIHKFETKRFLAI